MASSSSSSGPGANERRHTVPAVPRKNAAPDVFRAFRDLVYVHGVDYLAPRMGLRPGTLYNKADAHEDTHNQPTLRDVLLATQATGDMRVLDALDETFGRAAFDCTAFEGASDEALLELVTRLGAEHGEFHAALGAALRERRFSAEALTKIRGEGLDIVAAVMTLLVRLEGMVDDHA